MSAEATMSPGLELSASVSRVIERLGPDKLVSAAAFAQAIFELHDEYVGGSAAELRLKETPAERTAQEWLDEISLLFDPERIRSFSEPETFEAIEKIKVGQRKHPALHGRLAVIGLSLLEPRLREQMESAGALAALVEELREPLPEILTERGRALYDSPVLAGGQPDLSDTVPSWPDDPLLDPDQDLLGRAAFARFLARRIDAVEPESGAYSIHVHGPWGAGKSSLLNFLRRELEKQEWLVVEFNAWRHQHIQPPWWSLMDSVFKQTKKKLRHWDRFQEYWWRFNTGRLPYILGAIMLAWVLALLVFPALGSTASGAGGLESFANNAEDVSQILALVATVWGAFLAFNRSLLFGTPQAARTYTELTNDPTNEIRRRFKGLTERLPARMAILIDDLDRCQSHYVVDLLEGIQTLFREAPVVFVVAADRHWLNACYEEVYEKLRPRIHEPGKPLGTLFLEKAFRFSTPMPGLPEELKESYWQSLLWLIPRELNRELVMRGAATLAQAREEVRRARTESEVRNLLDTSRNRPFFEQRALREEAVVRLADPETLQRLEHTLSPYGPLLEPNPREMKLLVNSYSANRALAILSEVEIELHQLTLWTILSARWPQLADYLAAYPEMLERIGQPEEAAFPDDLNNDLKTLFADPDVIQVIKGNSRHAPLSIETLKRCVRIRS